MAETASPRGRWIPAAVRRPTGIVESMRWLYLLTAIGTLLLSVPAPLSSANEVTGPLAAGSSLVLIGSWIAGYRRDGSSLWLDLIDAAALCVFALSCPAPAVVFTFAFSALWYRSLYGSIRRAMVTCGAYALGICVALPLWGLVPNGFPMPAAAPIVGTVPAMFLVTVVGRRLGSSLFLRAESARRDAALAATGTALLNARDRAEIYAATDRAAAEICAATPGLRSIGVFPDGRGSSVAYPNGAFAEPPTALPAAVVEIAGDGRSGVVRDAALLDRAVGEVCDWIVIPSPDSDSNGYSLLGAPKRVPTEAVLAMTSLLNQAAFAMRNFRDRQCLTTQARTDVLTGLANRAAFTEALEHAAGPVAVLFVDLDDFKAVNDRLGHAAGDELLREVAARLTAIAGPSGVSARLGGDEFAVMLSGLPAAEVDRIAERMVAALGEPVRIGDADATVGASVGIADADLGQVENDTLLRSADQAMYAAKLAGKNQVRRHARQSRPALAA